MTGLAQKHPQLRLSDLRSYQRTRSGERREQGRDPERTSEGGSIPQSVFGVQIRANMVRAWGAGIHNRSVGVFGFFTTLAFWLRSSVVSVLNSLTTIMKAPPSLLVI